MIEEQWRPVATIDDIADGGYVEADVDGQSVLLIRFGNEAFALENVCSHAASTLSGGRLRNGRISCPLHGAVFDARTGAAIGGGLAPCGVRTFGIRVVDGKVELHRFPKHGLPR